jgi:hypothetical protein
MWAIFAAVLLRAGGSKVVLRDDRERSTMQRTMRQFLTVLALALSLCSQGKADTDEKVQSVLQRQQATVAQIREISLSIDRNYRIQGQAEFSRGLSNTWHWSRSLNKTRVLGDTNIVRPDGWPRNWDTFVDRRSKAVHTLEGWSENLPRPLKPWDNGMVSAYVDESFLPDHPFLDNGYVTSSLLLTFARPPQPHLEGEVITYYLPERFVPLAARVECEDLQEQGQNLVRVRLHWDLLRLTYTDLFFDPQAGYLVRKMEQLALAAGDASTSQVLTPRFTVLEATDIQAFPDGVFLPVKLSYRAYADPDDVGKTPVLESIISVKDLIINQPLPRDAFDFRFPENAIVRYFPPQEGKVKAMLWGPNNRPRQQIRSAEDILALARAEALAPRRRMWGAIAVAVAAAAILAGVSIWIRRRRTA